MKFLSPSEERIYGLMKAHGPMTRHQLIDQSGFSRETVWRTTTGLMRRGFVKQIGEMTHLGCKGMAGPSFAVTDEQLPSDALTNVISGWVRGV